MNDSENIFDVISAIQQGDYEVVSQAIDQGHVAATAHDKAGCTLLHWAAINNRCKIAILLLDHGADSNCIGGTLGETPLLWALRKKYYTMVQLLVQKGADLGVKSLHGNDALHMAVRMKDYYLLYMLLHLGADPNSKDSEGLTPLLWLLKHGNRTAAITRKEGVELRKPIRFLLNFGGSVLVGDPATQNNVLHLLAYMREFDIRTAFLLHSAHTGLKIVTNEDDESAFDLSNRLRNGLFSQFLMDALFYDTLNYHIVTAICAFNFLAAFFLVHYKGLLYGTVYWSLLYMLLLRKCLQWSLLDHQGRFQLGTFIGLYLATFISYFLDVAPYLSSSSSSSSSSFPLASFPSSSSSSFPITISSSTSTSRSLSSTISSSLSSSARLLSSTLLSPTTSSISSSSSTSTPSSSLILLSLALASVLLFYKINRSKPKSVVSLDRNEIVKRIVRTAPIEGPWTDADILKNKIKFRMCSVCKVDLTETVECSHCQGLDNHQEKAYEQYDFLYSWPTSVARTTLIFPYGRGCPGDRCNRTTNKRNHTACGICVIGLDGHYEFLGTCIGAGNRRTFVFFLLISCLFFSFFSILSLYSHNSGKCAITSTSTSTSTSTTFSSIGALYRIEECTVTDRPAPFFLTLLCIIAAMNFGSMLWMQFLFVLRQTTSHYVLRGHFNSTETPNSQLFKNLIDFCFRGTYVIYNSTDNVVNNKKKCQDKSCTENHGNNDHRNRNKNDRNPGKTKAKSSKKIVNTETKMKVKADTKSVCFTEEYDYNRVEEGEIGDEGDEYEADEEEDNLLSNTVMYVNEEERDDRSVDVDDNESQQTDDETEGHLLYAYSARHKRIEREVEENEENDSVGVAADRKHLMKGSTIGASDR